MAYRKLPTPATFPVTVPQLSGGLNRYDEPNRLADHQLTECNNLWWHQGALRTRPGLQTTDTGLGHFNIRQAVNERELLLSLLRPHGDGLKFYAALLSPQSGFEYLGSAGQTYYATAPDEKHQATAVGFKAEKNADTRWYYLLSGGDVIKENPNRTSTAKGKAWVEAEPYTPTIFINGKGGELVADTGATAYEDYNMLTRKFACTFTTDGESRNWQLPQQNLGTSTTEKDETGATVLEVELTVYSAEGGLRTVEMEITYGENGLTQGGEAQLTPEEAGVSPAEYSSVTLHVLIDRTKGIVRTHLTGVDASGPSGTMTISQGLPAVTDNNLKITAWRNRSYEENRLTICRMTRCTWFGGERSGMEGGTRLFVCGNPDKPNLLHWSGREHPLYFPELNKTYIGDGSQAITAFGQQGELLVLFKEREIYALQYVEGDEDEIHYAVEGGVALTTYEAKFPVLPISPAVGCDCPDTVRLVNNRLVWMNSDGRVYMLTATNQFSERNVRMISRNIQAQLLANGEKLLHKAQAVEYEGYYLLLVGKKVFLLDTQTSAFASFNYYSDEDSARKALPWFVWSLPKTYAYTGIVSDGVTLRLTGTEENNQRDERAFLLTGDTDDGAGISSRFATKWWDFGRPDTKKSIDEMVVSVGCPAGGLVWLTYLTEQGEFRDPYPIRDYRREDARQSRYLRRIRVTPHVRMVQGFGVRFECDGAMEVDGLYIKARQQGVVR